MEKQDSIGQWFKGLMQIKIMWKRYILTYLALCLVGAGLEWGYGIFWSVVGTTPYIYPSSPLSYTSLAVVPQWGFGGFIAISVYKAIEDRRARNLLGAVVPLVLAVLWILIYTQLIA